MNELMKGGGRKEGRKEARQANDHILVNTRFRSKLRGNMRNFVLFFI